MLAYTRKFCKMLEIVISNENCIIWGPLTYLFGVMQDVPYN